MLRAPGEPNQGAPGAQRAENVKIEKNLSINGSILDLYTVYRITGE